MSSSEVSSSNLVENLKNLYKIVEDWMKTPAGHRALVGAGVASSLYLSFLLARRVQSAFSYPFPGPRGSGFFWFLGPKRERDPRKVHVELEDWAKKYGPLASFRTFGRLIVVVSDLEETRKILRGRPKWLIRSKALAQVPVIRGRAGMFAAEGEDWKLQRRTSAPLFNNSKTSAMIPGIAEKSLRMVEKLKKSPTGVNVVQEMNLITLDIITSVCFSRDFNFIEDPQQKLKPAGEDFDVARFIKDTVGELRNVLSPVNVLLMSILPTSIFKMLPQIRKRLQRGDLMFQYLCKLMDSRKKALQEGAQGNPDLLDTLLSQPEVSSQPDLMAANLVTFITAGSETTAMTLSWLIGYLGNDERLQEEVREEINRVLGSSSLPRDLSDLENMKLLEACIFECLRLKSPAVNLLAETKESWEIGSKVVPPGTTLLMPLRYMMTKENPDFNPQFWLENPEKNVDDLLSFGGGARICPGRILAVKEAVCVSAVFFKHFRVKISEKAKKNGMEEIALFTLGPDQLYVDLEEVKDSRLQGS